MHSFDGAQHAVEKADYPILSAVPCGIKTYDVAIATLLESFQV
jgi:hypothetical protein